MTQNDFYVAIQGIMTMAHEQGWSIAQVIDDAKEAVAEWEEEMDKED